MSFKHAGCEFDQLSDRFSLISAASSVICVSTTIIVSHESLIGACSFAIDYIQYIQQSMYAFYYHCIVYAYELIGEVETASRRVV